MPPAPVYQASAAGCLRQGEILSDLIRFHLDVSTLGTDAPGLKRVQEPFVVVMTQDCDLESDHRVRFGDGTKKPNLPEVLFCRVPTAEDLRNTGINSTLWKRIEQNKDERYHFLQKVTPDRDTIAQGLPEMGIDFKRYFTLPTDEVYRRIELKSAHRRCVLVSPYLEHLSSRFRLFHEPHCFTQRPRQRVNPSR